MSPAWLNPDEVATAQIPTSHVDRIIEEAEGTGQGSGASESGVEPSTLSAEDGLEQALADRRVLIQLCLYALDRARSGGVVERLEEGLSGIGVRALRPVGERFDPALHEAGSAMPTEDSSQEGIIAETEVVGFADHDHVLRVPIVTVYTKA